LEEDEAKSLAQQEEYEAIILELQKKVAELERNKVKDIKKLIFVGAK